MLDWLLEISEAKPREKKIKAALEAAVAAGADRDTLDHEFSQLTATLAMLLATSPESRNAILVGYIRGYSDRDPDHYIGQARSVLGIGKLLFPGSSELWDVLDERLNRFLQLRIDNPTASQCYFRAVSLLLDETVGMAGDA